MTHQEQFQLMTVSHGQIQDITTRVTEIVSRSRVSTGIAHVFNVGSTAAIVHMECEPGLQRDLPALLDKLAPASRAYGHELAWHDGNGHSHLQATLLGPSLTLPILAGKLHVGMWQQIVHVECDVKPRQREIVVTIIGD